MWVIKLGGSLLEDSAILPWLNLIAEQGAGRLVIVPGGGVFADCVRQQQQQLLLSDAVAHTMAIMAMQQMALLFQDLQPDLVIANSLEQIQSQLSKHQTVIWSPNINWLNKHQIPENWDVSSDSLAAFLTSRLGAEHLIMVKSVVPPQDSSIVQWSKLGIVDKVFCNFVENGIFKISLINKSDLRTMVSLLINSSVER